MKKVLSLVLVLTLVLGSFSMAFAAETTETNLSDIAGNANEGAIEVANDLGIIDGYPDGTFKPDNAVTRAEFAKMMTKALNIPESALKGFKTSAFKDVDASHWAVTYLGYCNSKGIMTGYEDGTARPNQTITVNEAMTMICRAIGYTSQAKELVGSWPANYIALAQQLKLYDDVAATATTDRASAAQIIYNALTCELRYIDADGVTQWVTDKDGAAVTMLSSLGGYKAFGGEGFVLTSGMANTAVVNVNEYVGQFVKAYVNDDGDIIAVDVLSTTISGKVKADIFAGDDDVDYYYDKGLANMAKFNGYEPISGTTTGSVAIDVTNGVSTANHSGNNGSMNGDVGTNVTMAVKLSGKTIKEVYSFIDWTADEQSNETNQFKASDINFKKATITVDGKKFDFKTDKNGEIDLNSFALLGAASLEKIKDGDIVEVFKSATDNKVTRISVGTKTVTGTVTKVNADGDRFWIEGTKYAETGLGDNTPALGETGTAYLNYDGDIAEWIAEDATAGNYAVFTEATADNSLVSNASKVALVLKDGTYGEFSLASDYTVDPADFTFGTDPTPGVDDDMIVKYSFDAKGKINTNIVPVPAANQKIATNKFVNQNYTAYDEKPFAKDVIVFVKNGTKDWTTATVKDLKTKDGNTNNFDATYVLNAKGEIEVIAINKADLDKQYSFGLINTISGQKKGDDKKWHVEGVVDGDAFSAFTDRDHSAAFWIANETPAPAAAYANGDSLDLYKIERDAEGVVTGIAAHGIPAAQIIENATVSAIEGHAITLNDNGNKRTVDLSKDVAVYYYDEDDGFVKANLSEIAKDKKATVFSTTATLFGKGEYDIIVFWDAE